LSLSLAAKKPRGCWLLQAEEPTLLNTVRALWSRRDRYKSEHHQARIGGQHIHESSLGRVAVHVPVRTAYTPHKLASWGLQRHARNIRAPLQGNKPPEYRVTDLSEHAVPQRAATYKRERSRPSTPMGSSCHPLLRLRRHSRPMRPDDAGGRRWCPSCATPAHRPTRLRMTLTAPKYSTTTTTHAWRMDDREGWRRRQQQKNRR
jgi:hypothetical protein